MLTLVPFVIYPRVDELVLAPDLTLKLLVTLTTVPVLLVVVGVCWFPLFEGVLVPPELPDTLIYSLAT